MLIVYPGSVVLYAAKKMRSDQMFGVCDVPPGNVVMYLPSGILPLPPMTFI